MQEKQIISKNKTNIDLDNREFQDVLKILNYTSRSIFMTGKAGTGKSTFLRYITEHTRKPHIVLAPTGIAAVNVGGQTLHSFFKIPFKPLVPDDPELQPSRLRHRLKYNKPMVKLLKKIELIIIDEVSMVRADTIDFVDRVLRMYCGNPRQPFAGKQLLLVGDVFQLEPVITGETRDILRRFYPQPYFFNAMVFNQLNLVCIELRKIYRQNNPSFISLLDRIRIGRPTPEDMDLLNAKVIARSDGAPESAKDSEQKMTMTIATHRDSVDAINEHRLSMLKTPKHEFEGIVKGNFPENSLPADRHLVLKLGAQVVFVRNDVDRRWVNGTLARIVDIDHQKIFVQLENGDKHVVEREVWENIRYEYDEKEKTVKEIEEGTYTQFPLKLAWALTIHKSQGLTFENIHIDMGRGAFTGGQSYVALSRCTSLEGITMASSINQRDVFVSPQIVRFSQTFNDPVALNNALAEARADDCYHKAATAFDAGDMRTAAESFCEAVSLKPNELRNPAVARLMAIKLSQSNSKQKQIEALQQELETMRSQMRKLAAEYVTLGEDCREDGWEMNAAIANYRKALELSSDYTPALLGLGRALRDIDEIDESIDVLKRAAKADPKDFRPHLELGKIAASSGDSVGAIDHLLTANKLNKKIVEIHDLLADLYDKVESPTESRKHRDIANRLRNKKTK